VRRTDLNRALILGVLLLVALGAAACRPHEFAGTVLDPVKVLNDVELPATDGSTFRLGGEHDRLVLVFFGYTFCPDICPTTMLEARRAMEALGDDADEVQLVMVTVDPARDTPERLHEYVTNFHPSFLGLRTTDLDELDAILADFGAYYEIEELGSGGGENYLVTHTAALFLLDRRGDLREVFTYGASGEEIAADIRQFLRE